MAKCIGDYEKPQHVKIYPKGIKIFTKEGEWVFFINCIGNEGEFIQQSEEDLCKLKNEE